MAPSSQEGGARWEAAGCGSSGLLILQVSLVVSDVHFSSWDGLCSCFTCEFCMKMAFHVQPGKFVKGGYASIENLCCFADRHVASHRQSDEGENTNSIKHSIGSNA